MKPGPLRSKWGFATLTCLVLGNTVGAGVFTTSGFLLDLLGSPSRVLLAWGLGGVLALAGAVSYGQLAHRMTESGGEYLYLSRAWHPLAGFIAGWLSLIAGFSGATALAALALEGYVPPLSFGKFALPRGSLAGAVILLHAALHAFRWRWGTGLQNAAVVVKLAVFSGFCVAASLRIRTHDWSWDPLPDLPSWHWPALGAMAQALVIVSLSYSGFNAAVYVTEEARSPKVDVGRALVLGTVLVCVLYLVLNAIFVTVLPAPALANQQAIATVAAAALGGAALEQLVRVGIVLALWTSVSSMLMAGPRVYAKMAEDGYLPRWLRFESDVPTLSIIMQALIALLFVVSVSLQQLLNYLGLSLSLSAAITVACLFRPRQSTPAESPNCESLSSCSRSAEVKGSLRGSTFRSTCGLLWAPLIFVSGTLLNATLLTISDPRQVWGTVITIILGVILYFLIRVLREDAIP